MTTTSQHEDYSARRGRGGQLSRTARYDPSTRTDASKPALKAYEGNLGDDLLRGAKEISIFLYGTPDKTRRVFHLAATSRMPCFKMGSMLCARKSTLRAWIEEQEEQRKTRR